MSLWSLGARTRTRPTCPVCCAHCGLPAPAPCFREGSENGPAFCCRACRQVYDLMYDLMRELLDAAPTNEDMINEDMMNKERSFARAD